MRYSKIIVVLVVLAIMAFPAVITAFRIQTLLTTSHEAAIVTDCRSYRGYTRNYGKKNSKTKRAHTYYAPIAVGESGAIATGKIRLGQRKWCESMIGQKTSIYVHPTNPDKNMVGSYLQFWFIPSLLLIGLCVTLIPVSTRKKILMGLGFALFMVGALVREFGVFGVKSEPENIELSAENRLDRCIEKWMGFQEVSSPRELTKLTCERVDDLSFLTRLPKLEELFIHRSPITSLETLPVLPSLKSLRLDDNKALATLAGIERLENLEKIDMARNALADIDALGPLNNLVDVSFYRETFADISVLKDKTTLQRATFNVSRIKDLSPLYGKPDLMLAGVIGETVPCDQVAELKRSLRSDAKVWMPEHCE